MVSIRKAKKGFQLRHRSATHGATCAHAIQNNTTNNRETMGLVAGGLCLGVFLVVVFQTITTPREIPMHLRKAKPHPMLTNAANNNQPMGDGFNALALDILETLDCVTLMNATLTSMKQNNNNYDLDGMMDDFQKQEGNNNRRLTEENEQQQQRRRRLEQQHGDDGGFKMGEQQPDNNAGDDKQDDGEKWGDKAGAGAGDDQFKGDDAFQGIGTTDDGGGQYGGYSDLSAKHLFCIAASQTPPDEIVKQLACDATGTKRKALLDLWSAARAQMPLAHLTKVLGLAVEHKGQTLLDAQYNLWAPADDEGLTFMLSSLNSDKDADNGGLLGLHESLGPGKLFVDVGSCLGATVLAVASKYPGTKIISMEPASPNWLLQELNLKCNLEHDALRHIKIVLAGVGPNSEDEDNMMAKLMWRPTATTSTRAWTPSGEHRSNDMELVVRLRRLKSVLAEADVYGEAPVIDVLNVDCEGCEYNLIPALSEMEFDAIPTVMGGVHWGYIPTAKLPSSERAKTTHERLCQHENIARSTKECCAFPNLKVKSSVPGEVLIRDEHPGGYPPKDSTVQDVIDEGLCDDFDLWAADHYLFDVKDDWGWSELTSQA